MAIKVILRQLFVLSLNILNTRICGILTFAVVDNIRFILLKHAKRLLTDAFMDHQRCRGHRSLDLRDKSNDIIMRLMNMSRSQMSMGSPSLRKLHPPLMASIQLSVASEAANSGAAAAAMSESEQEELRAQLAEVEREMETLRAVLQAKQEKAHELRRKLGITPLSELKSDFEQSIKNIHQTAA